VAHCAEPRSNWTDEVEQIKRRCKELNAAIVSLDCKFRLLWYVEPDFVVRRGGHTLKKDAARSFIQAEMKSWVDNRDPEAVHVLSEDIGVPSELLDQMWSRGAMLWEPGKVRNSILPYSSQGSGIEAAFDGIAEWSHILSARQVTVYDHSPKLGHFDIGSLRRFLPESSDFRISEENSETVTVTINDADESGPVSRGRELRLDKASGFIVFESDHDVRFLHEHYEGGIQEIDSSARGIELPIFSANVIFRGDELFQAELFFVEECKLNHKIGDAEYALSVPGGTNVFYAGDMRPGEDTAKRNALANIEVRSGLEDVRALLPELRRKYEIQGGRVDLHVGRPLEQHDPHKSGNGWMIVAVNVVAILILCALWIIRARRRSRGK
jgi:hypothetical protein